MQALLQRVREANVKVDGEVIGAIQQGILAFIAIEPEDTTVHAERLLERVLGYRIFQDEQGKMNLSLRDIQGGLLIVSQFTLAADTQKGMRPSFSTAAPPERGEQLFEYFVSRAKQVYPNIQTGQFGAAMQVSLCNDGPVTFLLKVRS